MLRRHERLGEVLADRERLGQPEVAVRETRDLAEQAVLLQAMTLVDGERQLLRLELVLEPELLERNHHVEHPRALPARIGE